MKPPQLQCHDIQPIGRQREILSYMRLFFIYDVASGMKNSLMSLTGTFTRLQKCEVTLLFWKSQALPPNH